MSVLTEVVAFEQQRLAGDLGEGIGEAVAVVEFGRVVAAAVFLVRASCYVGLLERDRHNFQSQSFDDLVKPPG